MVPNETRFKPSEMKLARSEIDQPLSKRVICKRSHEQGEFISLTFLREKKDGSHRVILNLKRLNQFVQDLPYYSKKVDNLVLFTLDTAHSLMKPSTYAGSLDLKNAYYSVPVWDGHTKYLKFSFNGTLFRYLALPNGLK